MRLLIVSLFFLALNAAAIDRPRLIVLADINSFKAAEGDTSASQSIIRLLLYSDVLDIEGLVAGSGLDHGQKVRPDFLRAAIQGYKGVQQNLHLHSPDFPPAEDLMRLVKAGQPVAGFNVRVNDSIGRLRDTEASNWIIAAADKSDPRPLWICALGGTADLAQALWKVRDTRSEGDLLKFVAKLRVHAIGDQDATGPWLRENFPTLHYILREVAFRGMYRGGDQALVADEWIASVPRGGRGFLGELYPSHRGTDVWSRQLGLVQGVRESGSPSFLSLVPNGLNAPDRVGLSSWGGRLEGPELRPVDSREEPGPASDPDPRIAPVYRWRAAVQADFQARLDWCVKPRAEANHAPSASIAGETQRTLKPGETLAIDATDSRDPDGHALFFRWSIDSSEALAAGCKIEAPDAARARLIIPASITQGEVPVLLIVRDDGEPVLESYARVRCMIEE